MPKLVWTLVPENPVPGSEYYWNGYDETGQHLACVIVNRFQVAIQFAGQPDMTDGKAKTIVPATAEHGKALCEAIFESLFHTRH